MKQMLNRIPDSREAVIWIILIIFTLSIGLAVVLVRQTVEASVLKVAALLPLGYAFGAGMVASVNPCGFFMLPAYVAYYLGLDNEMYASLSLAKRLGRSIVVGGITSCGFMVVFGVLGGVTALFGSIMTRYFPGTGLLIGVGMIVLGVWLLLTRKTLGIMAASRVVVVPRKTAFNMLSFGMAYAVASLSCTLPIFLVVVGSAFSSKGIAASLGQFSAYAFGMSSVLIIVTVAAAFFGSFVISGFRKISQYSNLVSSFLLIFAGFYIVYYWLSYGVFS
jgi:cytochrome c biogenesis protein CcdA